LKKKKWSRSSSYCLWIFFCWKNSKNTVKNLIFFLQNLHGWKIWKLFLRTLQ